MCAVFLVLSNIFHYSGTIINHFFDRLYADDYSETGVVDCQRKIQSILLQKR